MTFKVVRFLDVDPPDLQERWARALEAKRTGLGRPRRVAVAAPLAGFPAAPFAAVDVQWFADLIGALANEAWFTEAGPDLALDSGSRVVAEEVVLRGEAYLGERWAAGGDRYKMMSFGKRDPRLTLPEFSARWRSEAGRLGADAIPDEVRGLAYVQNHPVPVDDHEWPFDAVNEVWFERLDHLRLRQAWFTDRPTAAATKGFMARGRTWSMFLRESPVP